jgi:hypothetical protein
VNGFDTAINNAEFWSSFGYGTLVVGLIGDIFVLVVPPHRERLEKILSAFFTIVIIIGVAIEHRADAGLSVLVSQQQQASNLAVEQFRNQNLELRKEGAALEKEAAEIRESVAPRRLTTKQRELLASHLREFAGRSLKVFSDPSDAEAAVFASEIYLALKSAKWNVDDGGGIGRGGGRTMTLAPAIPATGVDVPCGPPKIHDAAGKALVRELSKMGFDSECSTRNTGMWPLEVLARPEGPQGEAKLRQQQEAESNASKKTH